MGSSKAEIAVASVVLAVAGLVACSAVKIQDEKDCDDKGICKIDVKVDDSCSPMADPDPRYVSKDGTNGAVPIRWTAPPGYLFSASGIQFSKPGYAIDQHPGRHPSGKSWMIIDTPDPAASSPVSFKYRIELMTDDGKKTCLGPDPTIINR